MATTPIAVLREYTDEPTSETYSDERLQELLNAASGDIRKAASLIWSSKAARLASLVDVQEGNSSRKLGDLYEQAIAMSKHWSEPDSGAAPATVLRPARTRPIVRP